MNVQQAMNARDLIEELVAIIGPESEALENVDVDSVLEALNEEIEHDGAKEEGAEVETQTGEAEPA